MFFFEPLKNHYGGSNTNENELEKNDKCSNTDSGIVFDINESKSGSSNTESENDNIITRKKSIPNRKSIVDDSSSEDVEGASEKNENEPFVVNLQGKLALNDNISSGESASKEINSDNKNGGCAKEEVLSSVQNHDQSDKKEGKCQRKAKVKKLKKVKKASFCDSSSEDGELKKIPPNNENVPLRKHSQRTNLRRNKLNSLLAQVKSKKNLESEAEQGIVSNDDLFKDKDLYSRESSSDEQADKESSESEELEHKQKKQKPKKPKMKRPTKNDIKETISEQQRLCREQTFKIPYHVPEARPVSDFLRRVPNLKSQKKRGKANQNDCCAAESPYHSLFKQKPKLQESDDVIEFELTEEEETILPKHQQSTDVIDHFMQRFEKHTKKTPNRNAFPEEKCNGRKLAENEASQTPGERHLLLKNQLREKIRNERYQNHLKMEKQRKIMNEDEDEGEFDEEEMSSSNSESEKDSEDDEVEKWNNEDERKQVEDLMNALDAKAEEDGHEIKDDLNSWDDTSSTMSSILHAGQGDPTGKRIYPVVEGRETPCTKLLRSVLLDSTSHTSTMNDGSKDTESTVLTLPCENTQDLYKTDESAANDEEESQVPVNFNFQLDEDTQFEQILDSQGFLQNKKKTKKPWPKKLFDTNEPVASSELSMSGVLGFCSGKFPDKSTENLFSANLPTDSNTESGDVFELCSGKFTVNPTFNGQTNDKAFPLFDEKTDDSDLLQFCSGKFASQLNVKTERSSTDVCDLLEESNLSIVNNSLGLCSQHKCSGHSSYEAIDDVTDNAVDFSIEISNSQKQKLAADEEERIGDAVDDTHCSDAEDDVGEDVASNEEDLDSFYNESDNEELLEWRRSMKGKKKLNKRAFYEHEAELSGSDVDSDDEELGSGYDEYEIDEDAETLPFDDKMKKQLQRLHNRKMLDQDQQEIRLLQEIYLEDGELGAGNKRKRNFRWRNIDDVNLKVDAQGDSGGEEEELNLDGDVEKKIERLQKEKFLQDLHASLADHLDESSQSILNMIQDSNNSSKTECQVKAIEKFTSNCKAKPVSKKYLGSFLNGSKALSRLSSTAAGKKIGKTSRTYVFQVADEKVTSETENKTKSIKRNTTEPPAKKKKLNTTIPVHRNNSIFCHL